ATAKKVEPAKPRPAPITIKGIDPGFAKEILALEEKIADDVHAFDLFGLELNATRRDVRRAWGDLSRKFHPDALASQGLEVLRDRVGEAFAALSEAHQVLADTDARAQLAKRIAAGDYGSTTANDATATARAAFEAELLSREGEKLMRANNFARALVQFESAAAAYPEPGTDACIAWCTFQLSDKTPNDAALANTKLQRVIEEFPNIPPPHYFRGFVLMSLGHDDIATTEFTEAYRLDPRLIDAERQARALRQKKKAARESAAPSKSKGGLRGLFGKK
ncbi:MAG: DnaJ domain-containing protein, partial [Nannocystaceae bacterium]|nr:DnaJ domain-containing protein [Nannocystaceae bacterium]